MATIKNLRTSLLKLSFEDQLELIRERRESRFNKKQKPTLKRPERIKLQAKVAKLTDAQKAQLLKELLA